MRLWALQYHCDDNPWRTAPPWAIELRFMLGALLNEENYMSKELDDLATQVSDNSKLLDSATAMINGIADRITAAGNDPSRLQALVNELKSKDDALAAAIVANTPAQPLTDQTQPAQPAQPTDQSQPQTDQPGQPAASRR